MFDTHTIFIHVAFCWFKIRVSTGMDQSSRKRMVSGSSPSHGEYFSKIVNFYI